MFVDCGDPSPEEIAAIAAAIELALPALPVAAPPPIPRWRLAARVPSCELDALRHARDAWSLQRSD